MSDLVCRACGEGQPASSRADDACVGCGRPLRLEVRCPWCTAWTPGGGYCRGCGCKLVPPQHFGVARMLVHKGVDQLSLADRVATLEPGQRETFAAQFAEQLAVLAARVDELRACEQRLLTRGHAADFEDRLLPRLPLPREDLERLRKGITGALDGRGERLRELFEAHGSDSPARQLAAIALLRRGEAPPGVLGEVQTALGWTATALDAAVALACWRARPHVYASSWQVKQAREVAQPALSSERLGPWAAVVLARWSSRPPSGEVADRLRQGLSSRDPELRFDCALALGDETELSAALDSAEPEKAGLARRALASTGHPAVLRALAEGPDPVRRDVLSGLSHPISAQVAAALATALPRAASSERDRIVGFVRGQPFHALDAETRAEWGRWARAGGRGVTPEQAFELLEWATRGSRSAGWDLQTDEETGAFVQLAADAFRALDTDARARLVRDSAFARLLVLATGEHLPLLGEVAQTPELVEDLLEQLYWAHAVAQRDGSDARAVEALFRIWDAAGERRESLVAPLAKVTRSHRGISGRELFLDRICLRLRLAAVEERSRLAAAFEPWRDELEERYDADPALPKDPVERFRFWAEAAPEAIWHLMSRLWDRVPRERVGALMEAAFDAAARIVGTHPRTAVATVSRAAAALVNTYREAPAPALDAWISALATRFAAFEVLFRSARPESDSEAGAENLLEDVRTELRLAAEARQRREDGERRAREEEQRHLERLRREEERRELEQRREEQLRRDADARAAALAEQVAVAVAVARAVPPGLSPEPLTPRIPPEPLDSEPLLPGTPLPTLVDYVRFLKELSSGRDVMQLFSTRGLTAQSWAVLVNGWSAILTGRMEVGLRFGSLMAAPWA